MWTVIRDIHTARVFIPEATGYTRKGIRTFGINRIGYSESYYNDLKQLGNRDDIIELRPFYDLLRDAYGAEFPYPTVHPYVQYVDYMKSIGGGFSADNKKVIKHLRKHCNTLIVTDEEERDYLNHIHSRCLYTDISADYPLRVPPRFAALQKKQRQY